MESISKGLRAGIITSVGEIKPHKPTKTFPVRKDRRSNDKNKRRIFNRTKNRNRG